MRNTWIFAFSALALIGCRDGGTGDDTPQVDAPGAGENTIQEVQNDAMAPGSPVTLRGVVVTAIDNFGTKTGDFWVQEPGGGPYSGVHVYGAPLDQVAALVLGDIVDISGAQKEEFALTSDTSGKTLTELEPLTGSMMTVTKVGTGAALTPQVIDALAIGQMADFNARHAEWEKWEGVLVTVSNVQAFGAPACVGSACSDMTLEKFDITGDVVVESALAAFPTGIARSACLGSVTGVVDYFFDYLIFNRTTAEITTGGTSCPTENMSAVCADGIDNDGNGFSDCGDNSCIGAEAVTACRTTTTIAAIQTAIPTGGVELQNVFVTAVSFNKKSYWVSTSLTAAAGQGIYVNTTSVLPTTVVAGATVDVYGKAVEFNDTMGTETLTEINGYGVKVDAAPTTQPVPVNGVQASAMAETYESVLVRLVNVKVTVKGASAGYYVGELQQGTTLFLSDDDILRLTDNVGTCFTEIVGIWTYQVYDNKFGLLPISKTTGGTCP